MEKRKLNYVIVILGLIGVLTPGQVQTVAEDPLDFSSFLVQIAVSSDSLNDFVFLPGSAVLVDPGHILALFENSRNGLYAVVVFAADCNQAGCTIKDLISYSIFDPWEADSERTDDSLRIKNKKIPQTRSLPDGSLLKL